ncbi:hypothetical protein INT47_010046 [Mucor saturninus]|uniref:RING-type domain-containing protein n=1 Tax=Mucor saturninus TaxID=64648 RepID=A0A8H7UQV7_9FUNG|nr:hypothetical protein INT47_010046 [Mucor saturninus]
MPSTRLSHRHLSNVSFSSSSSSSSTRPALPQILSNSASNAVNFSRSTAPTSRRVRTHWFTHFILNWRRSSRSSKLLLGFSMTLLIIQVMASIAVLFISWEMYCDKPLRWFVTVYIVRLVLTAPIVIYTHLIPPRRRSTVMISPRTSVRSELAEAYAMSERNRPLSVPPPALPTPINHRHQQQYPTLMTPVQQPPIPALHDDPFDENVLRLWIDRAKSGLDLFAVLWFIIGNYMLFSSSTCSDTAVPLYYLSLVLTIYGYFMLSVPVFLCTSVIFCLPCVLVGMRLLHVDDGVYMGGATTEEIGLIPTYQFQRTQQQKTAVDNEGFVMLEDDCHITIDPIAKGEGQLRRSGMLDKLWLYLGLMEPPCESEPVYEMMEIRDVQDQVCVICLSTYEGGDMLSRLWCKHHFHRACIKEWLILNRRCPLCKQDFGGKDALFDI